MKIVERLFLARIQPYILSSLNFNQYQSAEHSCVKIKN